MNKELTEMFRYNAWANRQLFGACRSLTEEQLDTHIQGTSGSVRELLMHIAGAQQTFVLRTKGRQHEGELGRQSSWPGMDAVIQIAASTSDELIAIAEQLKEDQEVDLHYQGKTYRYPKRFFFGPCHAAQHGTPHRGKGGSCSHRDGDTGSRRLELFTISKLRPGDYSITARISG